jgi:hypothetical protein
LRRIEKEWKAEAKRESDKINKYREGEEGMTTDNILPFAWSLLRLQHNG